MNRIAVILAFAWVGACSLLFAAGAPGTRVVEPEGGFSYTAPAGWRVMTFPGLKYKIASAAPVKGFAPNINVVDQQYHGSIQDYVRMNLAGIRKQFIQFKYMGQSPFTTSGGLKGVKMVIQSKQANRLLRQEFFLLPGKGDRKYVVTFSVLAGEGSRYDSLVASAVRTFTVK